MARDRQTGSDGSGDTNNSKKRELTNFQVPAEAWSGEEILPTKSFEQGTNKQRSSGDAFNTPEVKAGNPIVDRGQNRELANWGTDKTLMPVPVLGDTRQGAIFSPVEVPNAKLVSRKGGSDVEAPVFKGAPDGPPPLPQDAKHQVEPHANDGGTRKVGLSENVGPTTQRNPVEGGQQTKQEPKSAQPGSPPTKDSTRDATLDQLSSSAIVPSTDKSFKGPNIPRTQEKAQTTLSEDGTIRRPESIKAVEQAAGDKQVPKPITQSPSPVEGAGQRNASTDQRRDEHRPPTEAVPRNNEPTNRTNLVIGSHESGDTRSQQRQSGDIKEYSKPGEATTRNLRDGSANPLARDVAEKKASSIEAGREGQEKHVANQSTPFPKADARSLTSNDTPPKGGVKGELAEPTDARLTGREINPKRGPAGSDTANSANQDGPRIDATRPDGQKTKFADTQGEPPKKAVRTDAEPGASRTITGTKGPRIEDVDFIVGDRKGLTPFGGKGSKVPFQDPSFDNNGGKKSGKGDSTTGDTRFGDSKIAQGDGNKSVKGDGRFPGKNAKVTDMPGEPVKDVKGKGPGGVDNKAGATKDGAVKDGVTKGGTGKDGAAKTGATKADSAKPEFNDGRKSAPGGGRSPVGDVRGGTGRSQPGDVADGRDGVRAPKGIDSKGQGIGGPRNAEDGARRGQVGKGLTPGETGGKVEVGVAKGDAKGERGTIAEQIEAAKARFDDAQSKIKQIMQGKDLRTIDSAGVRQNDGRPQTAGGIRQDDFGTGRVAKPLKGDIGAGAGIGESGRGVKVESGVVKGDNGVKKGERGSKIDSREQGHNIETPRRPPREQPGKDFDVKVSGRKEPGKGADARVDGSKKPGRFIDDATKVSEPAADVGKQRKEIPGVRSDGTGGVFIPSPNVRLPDIGIRIPGGKSGSGSDKAPIKPGDTKPVDAKQSGDTMQVDLKQFDAKQSGYTKPFDAKQLGDAKQFDAKQSGDTKQIDLKQSGDTKQFDAKQSGDTKDVKQPGKDARTADSQNLGGLRETKDAFGGKLPTIRMGYGNSDVPSTRAESNRSEPGRGESQGVRGDSTGVRIDTAVARGDNTGARGESTPPADTFVPLKGGIASDAAVKGSFETKPTSRMEVDPAKAQAPGDSSKSKDASKQAANQEQREARAASEAIHHAKGFTVSGVEARSDRRDIGVMRNDGGSFLDESKGMPRSIRDIFIKYRLPLTRRGMKVDISDSGTYRVATGQSSQRLKALASSAKLTALKSTNDSSASLPSAGGQGEGGVSSSVPRHQKGDSITRDEEPRKWHIVKEGEDERFIASVYLNDESLAGLIKEINKPVFQTVYDVASQQNVEVLPVGAMILLPNGTDIEEYRSRV